MNQDLSAEAEKSLLIFTKHLEALKSYKDFINTAKDNFSRFSAELDFSELEKLEELVDLSALITIAHLDLITSNKSLNNSKSDWERIFFIKSIYLVIYETLVTFEKYRQFINNYTNTTAPELKPNLDQLSTDIRNFKKDFQYTSHINLIRNNIIGHISKDFSLYYDTIRQFDGEKTAQMSIAFFKVIQALQNYLNNLLKARKIDETKIAALKKEAENRFIQLKELIETADSKQYGNTGLRT